jgi:hypothetical protein
MACMDTSLGEVLSLAFAADSTGCRPRAYLRAMAGSRYWDKRPYEGVTLADWPRQRWMWANCGLPCGRSVALPLAYFRAKLGDRAPVTRMLSSLRCSRCGKHPSGFTAPSRGALGQEAELPLASVPRAIREQLSLPPRLRFPESMGNYYT